MIYMEHNNIELSFSPVQWDTWKFNKIHAKQKLTLPTILLELYCKCYLTYCPD